ncbi:hypothetical protein RRG08_060827 [Elysia crispata]|uniref:Uncharacterized protein n=1 Tax=Elysia crispata TaxID=231223 RepID=A0AAE1DFZ1_9GAST|nr:hypothetical protein RRG08_060827 [Elysia crispata]
MGVPLRSELIQVRIRGFDELPRPLQLLKRLQLDEADCMDTAAVKPLDNVSKSSQGRVGSSRWSRGPSPGVATSGHVWHCFYRDQAGSVPGLSQHWSVAGLRQQSLWEDQDLTA